MRNLLFYWETGFVGPYVQNKGPKTCSCNLALFDEG